MPHYSCLPTSRIRYDFTGLRGLGLKEYSLVLKGLARFLKLSNLGNSATETGA